MAYAEPGERQAVARAQREQIVDGRWAGGWVRARLRARWLDDAPPGRTPSLHQEPAQRHLQHLRANLGLDLRHCGRILFLTNWYPF